MAGNTRSELSRRSFLRATTAGVGGLAAWSVLGGSAANAAVRGAAARRIPFDVGWLFGGVSVEGSSAPDFDDRDFGTVTLPHSVTELSWRGWDPVIWEQVWIYRKHFTVPAELARLRLFLDFAGVMTRAAVTLNGTAVPGRLGGYLPFGPEITDVLHRKENVLAVEVDARFGQDVPPDRPGQPSTSVDFWQPGGIYREVQLRAVPQIFLADVFAQPVDVLDAGARRLEVSCTVDAAVIPASAATVLVELSRAGSVIAAASAPVRIAATGQSTSTVTLDRLPGITLWDNDNPVLYDVTATLEVGGVPVHDYRLRTGFRQARFELDGFYLNGRRIKPFGLNRHQFFPFAGGAMPARVQRRDAEILRTELNTTMVRCSHYPQSDAFLDACDELGLMVWEEAPGWGYLGAAAWKDLAVRDVGEMVRRDRNHPSVIIWVPG